MSVPLEPEVPRRWREGTQAEAGRVPGADLRRRLFALLATVLALSGLAVVLLASIRPAPLPRFLPLWACGDPAASGLFVPQAGRDLDSLLAGRYFSAPPGSARPGQARRELLAGLDSLQSLGAAETAVVYLDAVARAAKDGELSVLPSDASLDDPRTWLPLKEVAQALARSPARRKLLVLDVAKPQAGTDSGVLADDIPDRLVSTLKDVVGADRLLVLASCSPGQVSLTSEEMGRSVFGFYFEQGLRGWADRDLASGNRDGLVSVRELARYAAARVDRWAALNRKARQSPILLGSGNDFPLVQLAHGRPRGPLSLPEASKYPAWLLEAWKERDRWHSDRGGRDAPRTLRRFQSALLEVEARWRGGGDPDRLRKAWEDESLAFRRQFERAGEHPTPTPHSLALARALGSPIDVALAAEVGALVTKWAEQSASLKAEDAEKARGKLVGEVLARAKGKGDLDVAWSVFQAAADIPLPGTATVQALDQVLAEVEPSPRFAETFFLRRMAELARTPGVGWSAETVHRAFAVVRRTEQAECRPRSLSWAAPRLDRATRERHAGEVALESSGFVPAGMAARAWTQAEDASVAVLSVEDAIEEARDARDEAMLVLPALVPWIDHDPRLETDWEGAVREARDLDRMLLTPPRSADDFEWLQAVEGVGQRGRSLRDRLDRLRRPFEPGRLAALVARSRSAGADGFIIREIDALLATPLVLANDRPSLWAARRDLAMRLLETTFRTSTVGDDGGDPVPWRRRLRQDAARRARMSIALLDLAGLAAAEVEAREKALRRAAGPKSPTTAWTPLGFALRRDWAERLPAAVKADDLPALDRLARLLPPSIAWPTLDRATVGASALLRNREDVALWTWLANRYDHESRDLDGSAFLSSAARDYRILAAPIREPSVRLAQGPDSIILTPDRRTAVSTLRIDLDAPGGAAPALALRLLKPDDDWLDIRPILDGAEAPTGQGEGERPSWLTLPVPASGMLTLPLRVELKASGERSGTPPPKGFLAQVQVGGRTFSLKVPVAPRPASAEWKVFLAEGDSPDGPGTAIDELRLRPSRGRKALFLFVGNPTAADRTVLVDVQAGDVAYGDATWKLAVKAGQVGKLVVSGPPPKPDEALPEWNGPPRLIVRIRDASQPDKVLQTKGIGVSIASPAEYVRVSDIRFEPPSAAHGGKNRLTVRLRAARPLGDPPCAVDLVLPPARIPGLRGVKDGTFHGELPAKLDQELTLFAEDLALDEGAEEQGQVELNIDGDPRALTYRTTFARRGDPTTPRPNINPDLRLVARPAAVPGSAYLVGVEVDNAPDDASLEIVLGRIQGGVFVPDRPAASRMPRRGRLGFTPFGKAGAWLFDAAVADWEIPLDTGGIQGRREVRATLRDGDGRVLKAATHSVVLDDAAPRLVRFVDPPAQARRGSTVVLKAAGSATESGTKQVLFFVGKPEGDKVPPKVVVVAGSPTSEDPAIWSARLPLPEDRKGPIDVSVQFLSGADRGASDTTTIELLDTDPVGTGRIAGTVIEGDRPQPGLEVLLGDARGAVLKAVKTGPDGRYSFEGLAPGKYQVYSAKAAAGTQASKVVDVEAGDTPAPGDLTLFRR